MIRKKENCTFSEKIAPFPRFEKFTPFPRFEKIAPFQKKEKNIFLFSAYFSLEIQRIINLKKSIQVYDFLNH